MMVLIDTNNLAVGDVIAKSVINSKGSLVVSEGYEMRSSAVLRKLLDLHGITHVYVHEREDACFKKRAALSQITSKLNSDKATVENEISSLLKDTKASPDKLMSVVESTVSLFKESYDIFGVLHSLKCLDASTYIHLQNVALVSYMIGVWTGLKGEELDKLLTAGLLGDVGKMQIDEAILNKPDKLEPQEEAEIRRHPIYSLGILKRLDIKDKDILDAVHLHHERLDGSGYPNGYTAERIPRMARIVAIADVYTALTTDRPYRKRYTPFEAIRVLQTEYSRRLDLEIILTFTGRLLDSYLGSTVTLSDGSEGSIVYINNVTKQPLVEVNGEVLDIRNSGLTIVEFT